MSHITAFSCFVFLAIHLIFLYPCQALIYLFSAILTPQNRFWWHCTFIWPMTTTGTVLNWPHWGRNICKWDLVLTTTTSLMSYFRHKHSDCACRSVEDWHSVNVRWSNAMCNCYLIENWRFLYFQLHFIIL